jgi:farnesyl-diphosphate farnesyltransferase
MTGSEKRSLLREILKGVSRSFYLTLWVVPARVREQLGLAYLFCRAADTIADTDLIPSPERLKYLYLFREQFQPGVISWQAITQIQNSLVQHQGNPAEKVLLSRLSDCFRIFEDFTPPDRARIRHLVTTLTKGMEMDLTCFPGEGSGMPVPLPSGRELEQYCYYVAGVVGEFWTRMIMGHFESLGIWDERQMGKLGVHFGKGLQMTNVLKDLAKDLARGRCYLPQNMLDEFKLGSQDLKESAPIAPLRPLLASLIRVTLYHLEGGWQYILAIPRREIRLRLACLWPHLFAIRTLERIYHAEGLLNPRYTVKISRREVYSIMAITTLLVCSNSLLTRYYERLRSLLITRVANE